MIIPIFNVEIVIRPRKCGKSVIAANRAATEKRRLLGKPSSISNQTSSITIGGVDEPGIAPLQRSTRTRYWIDVARDMENLSTRHWYVRRSSGRRLAKLIHCKHNGALN